MNLVINLDRWTNLAPWKRRWLRNMPNGLHLGTPATGSISGTRVAVFSDARFSATDAYFLGTAIMAVASLPDTIPESATPQDAFDAAGVPQASARFFDTLPAGWTPDE